jgi:hypothetical protein
MSEEKRAEFEFLGRQTRYAWLKLLEGGDAGMRLAVPRRHDEYKQEKPLKEASEGDRLKITLVSDSDVETNLRAKNVVPCGDASAPTHQPASD